MERCKRSQWNHGTCVLHHADDANVRLLARKMWYEGGSTSRCGCRIDAQQYPLKACVPIRVHCLKFHDRPLFPHRSDSRQHVHSSALDLRELTLQSLGEKLKQTRLRAVTNVACIYLTARER